MGGMYGGMSNQNEVNRIRGELQRAQSQEQVLKVLFSRLNPFFSTSGINCTILSAQWSSASNPAHDSRGPFPVSHGNYY